MKLYRPIDPHHYRPSVVQAIAILHNVDAHASCGMSEISIDYAAHRLGNSYAETASLLVHMLEVQLRPLGISYAMWLRNHTGVDLLELPRAPVDINYLRELSQRWIAESIVLMMEQNLVALSPPFTPPRSVMQARQPLDDIPFDRDAWGPTIAYAKLMTS